MKGDRYRWQKHQLFTYDPKTCNRGLTVAKEEACWEKLNRDEWLDKNTRSSLWRKWN